MKKNEIFTVPNAVTTIHIIFLIPLFYCLKNQLWIAAGLIFLFTGGLDLLDGWLARKLHQVSKLGKVLDPLADKGGSIVVLYFLIGQAGDIVYKTIFSIFLAMEIFLLLGSLLMICLKKTEEFQVTKLGKYSMFSFFLILNLFIFNLYFQFQIVFAVLLAISVILIVVRLYCLTKYSINYFKKKAPPS